MENVNEGIKKMNIKLGFKDVCAVDFWRKVAAEFLGTTFLLLCISCVALSWGNPKTAVSANNVEIGIGVGFAVATIAFAFGHVSGGHVNPAVSLAMMTGGRIPLVQGIMYIFAQLLGGIVGSSLTYSFLPEANKNNATLGVTTVHDGVTGVQAFGLEFLFTFLFVFYIFSATDPVKNTDPCIAALGIGVALVGLHVCLIPFTGCSLNPARSFGPAVVTNHWIDHWVYWVGPLLGGVLASLLYKFVFFVNTEKRIRPIQVIGAHTSICNTEIT